MVDWQQVILEQARPQARRSTSSSNVPQRRTGRLASTRDPGRLDGVAPTLDLVATPNDELAHTFIGPEPELLSVHLLPRATVHWSDGTVRIEVVEGERWTGLPDPWGLALLLECELADLRPERHSSTMPLAAAEIQAGVEWSEILIAVGGAGAGVVAKEAVGAVVERLRTFFAGREDDWREEGGYL